MAKKRVLIVEDEELIRDAYKLILQSDDLEVFTANNGVDGLKEMKLRNPSVILLDVFMPVMDGLTFLKNLDLTEYPESTVIACTNLSDADTRKQMLELGAVDVVLKSDLDPRALLDLVKSQDANSDTH